MSPETGKTTAPGPAINLALKAQISEAYARQSREAFEERWIVENLPMVSRIARRVASYITNQADMEDLVSAGTVGLVRAARAFDPNRNAEFKTYAYIRIRGAIIDELRSQSFVPTAVHKQIRQIQDVCERFMCEHNRMPGDSELAKEVGLPLEKLYQLFQKARKQHFLSIHGLSEASDGLAPLAPVDGAPSPEAQLERKEQLALMTKAIQELPKRDRILVLLYYERELSMKEIAEVFSISESRVSQLHASAIFKLSVKLR